ncbi:Translation initiation factor eIF-2B subunit beta [Fasciola gigantica]|uniref:Translation initiation factor eIF2B subunit beta n=1 Tax=Fasciola gigantica TaxID=46835 RepID=A0A504Y7X7_FASGI|nr:Translation initiation factor eIF-2B subunit beta [Fasciola gigantica]
MPQVAPIQEPSYKVVLSAFESLRSVIIEGKWFDLKDLIALLLEETTNSLRSCDEVTPTLHIALRIIKIAREEALKVSLGANADFEENTTNRLFASGDTTYETVHKEKILDPIVSAIDELIIDIKSCSENISDLSLNFIHSDETILTCGFSHQVYQFLRRASEKKRIFKVIVCEGFPGNMGHKLAEDLTKDGISVILVPDTHSFAMMSRVNKVIIGCDAVYPDGTLKAPVGTYSVVLAAKHFSTPTYVCLPQYKISPISCRSSSRSNPPFRIFPTADPSNPSLDWLDSPAKILPPHDPVVISGGLAQRAPSVGPVVWNPRWEIIPAGFVSLFLTNLGSHAPSYLYALGRELFHHLDVQAVSSW